MVDSSLPKSFLQAGQIKKYQIRSRHQSVNAATTSTTGERREKLDGIFFADLLQPNLTTNRQVFRNKNLDLRKNLLKRKNIPRRDSEENLSFWTTQNKKRMKTMSRLQESQLQRGPDPLASISRAQQSISRFSSAQRGTPYGIFGNEGLVIGGCREPVALKTGLHTREQGQLG